MKKFSYYFCWTIIIGFIIYIGTKYQLSLKQEAERNLDFIPVILFSSLFSVVIGFLLRIPKLIIEIKQNKQWTFDWIKFSAVALPSFFIIVLSILPFTNIGEFTAKIIPLTFVFGEPTIQIIACVVFGYTLLDCLKK